MHWIEKQLSLVSVPGYCFPVQSTSVTATEVFYLKLTVPRGFRDLAPHTQDAPSQDAIKAHCSVTLCYLPTLSSSKVDGLTSCPVQAFLVLSSFDFHFMLFQPHLPLHSLSPPPLFESGHWPVLSSARAARPPFSHPWFVSFLYGSQATWGCEFSVYGLSLSDWKPFIPYQMITSWREKIMSGTSFNAYTMGKIIGIHLTSLRFFFACKITTINYTCPTKHIWLLPGLLFNC